jgi:hypothetical protein
MKEDRKAMFIDNLKASGGIICVACESTGINRSTYYRWRESDKDFADAVDEVMEAQIDFVESKLMELVNAHDTTATIFYLKTKGKKRGWTEKQQPIVAINAEPQPDLSFASVFMPNALNAFWLCCTKSKYNFSFGLIVLRSLPSREISTLTA